MFGLGEIGGASWWTPENDQWVVAIETTNWTRDFIESPKGRYWLSWSGETAYFDGSKWIRVPLTGGGGQLTFFEDDEGTLWGAGNGIYKWQESNQSWLKVTGDEAIGAQFRAAKKGLDGTWRIMSDDTPIFATFDGEKLFIHPSSNQGDVQYRNVHGDGFAEYPSGVFWLATIAN